MPAKIDQEKCIGCGVCESMCGQGIKMLDGKAAVKDENAACLKDAADACPINIIELN